MDSCPACRVIGAQPHSGQDQSYLIWARPGTIHRIKDVRWRTVGPLVQVENVEKASRLGPIHTEPSLEMSDEPVNYALAMLPRGNACTDCRRRKRKCDGVMPSCTACRRMGRACQYNNTSKSQLQLVREKLTELEKRLHDTVAQNQRRSPSPAPKAKIILQRSAYNMAPAPSYHKDWWLSDAIPRPVADLLVTVFLKHSTQFLFEEQVSSLIDRLYRYTPSHPKYPRESVLNAIYLCAAFYVGSSVHPIHNRGRLDWDFEEVEKRLLRKTRKSLTTCLTKCDNMFDFLLGSTLLVKYYYYTGRTNEGHHDGSGVMRFAAACNLLSVQDGDVSSFPKSILGQPTSGQDVRDRVYAFWNIFIMDRFGSFSEGLAVSIPDEKITTTFPNPMWSSTLPIGAMLIQVRELVTEAARQGVKSINDAPTNLTLKFRSAHRVLTQFINSLSRAPRPFWHEIALPRDLVLCDLAFCNTVALECMIHLHGPFASRDEESRATVLSAASDIVAIAEGIDRTPEIDWPVAITMGWGNACEVFYGEIRRLADQNTPDPAAVDKIMRDMEFLVKMSKRYLKVYRGHTRGISAIDQIWKASAAIVKRSNLGSPTAGWDRLEGPRHPGDTRPTQYIRWLGWSVTQEQPPFMEPSAEVVEEYLIF